MNRKERRAQSKKPNSDPFEWRDGGKMFKLGDEGDGNLSSMIKVDERLICVLRKSVNTIQLASEIDPKKTDVNVPDTKQRLLSYGSDDTLVARTLLQAEILLAKGSLIDVDIEKGMSIAWAFTQELASLHELALEFQEEEAQISLSYSGKRSEDSSLQLPFMKNLEQKTKQFSFTVDSAMRLLMQLAQVFYPTLPSEKWVFHLSELLKKEKGDSHPSTIFVLSIVEWVHLMRDLRSAVVHPKTYDKVTVENYRAVPKMGIFPPTIRYDGSRVSLPEMRVSTYMTSTVENLETCFEGLLVALCNAKVQSIIGPSMRVLEVPEDKRSADKAHVRFGYYITP